MRLVACNADLLVLANPSLQLFRIQLRRSATLHQCRDGPIALPCAAAPVSRRRLLLNTLNFLPQGLQPLGGGSFLLPGSGGGSSQPVALGLHLQGGGNRKLVR